MIFFLFYRLLLYVRSSELGPIFQIQMKNHFVWKSHTIEEKGRRDKSQRKMKFKNEERAEENVKNASHSEHWLQKNFEHSAVHATELYSWYKGKLNKNTAQNLQNICIVPIRRISDLFCMKESPVTGFLKCDKAAREQKKKTFFFLLTLTCLLVGSGLRMPFVFDCVDRRKECLFFLVFSFPSHSSVVSLSSFLSLFFFYFVCLAVLLFL